MSVPTLHQEFIDRALSILRADERIEGVALAGSYATQTLDEQSDLDFVIVVDDPVLTLSEERFRLAKSLGNLLQAFTGEHVGEPRLIIALYGPPLLHVDLKFVTLDQLAHRVDDPVVLFDRNGRVAPMIFAHPGAYPRPNAQWMEDRFWVWIHYCAGKLRRGETMEAYTAIGFLLERVLVPLAMDKHGFQGNGVRRLEQSQIPEFEEIRDLCIAYDPRQTRDVLLKLADLYKRTRPDGIAPSPAQDYAIDYLREVDFDSGNQS